jgi:hypothetical protein
MLNRIDYRRLDRRFSVHETAAPACIPSCTQVSRLFLLSLPFGSRAPFPSPSPSFKSLFYCFSGRCRRPPVAAGVGIVVLEVEEDVAGLALAAGGDRKLDSCARTLQMVSYVSDLHSLCGGGSY